MGEGLNETLLSQRFLQTSLENGVSVNGLKSKGKDLKSYRLRLPRNVKLQGGREDTSAASSYDS